MKFGKDHLINEARRIAGALDELDRRARALQSQHARRVEIQTKRISLWTFDLDYFGKHSRLKRAIDRCAVAIKQESENLERFYELISVNLDSAVAVVNIAQRNMSRLAQELEGLEHEASKASQPKPTILQPQEPSKEPPKEPIRETLPLRNLEIAYATRNEHHGEDSVREIQNNSGELKGLVVCDGITNSNGATASKVIAESIQSEFRTVRFTGEAMALRSQLDLCLTRAVRRLHEVAEQKGIPETATTLLVGFTDGKTFYLYYLGDGTIREYSEDAYSVADMLLTYERGGALAGYVSSLGITGKPSFASSENHSTEGKYLILATDGAELGVAENHYALGAILRDTAINHSQSIRDALEKYLDTMPQRSDDSTIGAIWIRESHKVSNGSGWSG